MAKEHLKIEGLKSFVNIRATLNTGINQKLKNAFADLIPVEKPNVIEMIVPNPE
jgi:hypothetical protein